MIMSNKVTKSENEKIKHQDKVCDVEKKVEKLADMVRDAKNIVVFTGDQINLLPN